MKHLLIIAMLIASLTVAQDSMRVNNYTNDVQQLEKQRTTRLTALQELSEKMDKRYLAINELQGIQEYILYDIGRDTTLAVEYAKELANVRKQLEFYTAQNDTLSQMMQTERKLLQKETSALKFAKYKLERVKKGE